MSHVNELFHMWVSHVSCTDRQSWAPWISHMRKLCDTWISHVTYAWGMTNARESCHIWMSHATCKWVMFHTQAFANKSWYTWTSHVLYTGRQTECPTAQCAHVQGASAASRGRVGWYVCCSVLQRTAVCCSVMQCVVVCCNVLQCGPVWSSMLQCIEVCCSMLQCVHA